jgi:type IV secretory pathway VirB2 component (pilin)
MTFSAALAPAYGSIGDPAGSSVLVAAASWLQATLLGTVATTIAVIAVASIGFMMLSGRVNVRHGLTVIGGSFILFGATSIVAGLQSLAPVQIAAAPVPYIAAPIVAAPPVAAPPPASGGYDPYAGASVPTN